MMPNRCSIGLCGSGYRKALIGTVAVAGLLAITGCAVNGGSGPVRKAQPPETVSSVAQRPTTQVAPPLTAAQREAVDRARMMLVAGNPEAARSLLAGVRAERPDAAEVTARLGWVAQQLGNINDARALYREAIQQDPGEVMAVNNLALLLQEDGAFREAQLLLQKGLEVSGNSPELHYNLATLSEIYLLDLEAALRHYRRYQELAKSDDNEVAGWIRDLERRVD